MRKTHGSGAMAGLLVAVFVAAAAASLAAQSMERDGYVLPPASVQELFKRDKNYTTLERLSPDGDHFLIPKFQELTDLKLMSQRTLRLAMLELVPAVNREWRLATYGNEGLSLYSLKDRRSYPIKLPAGAFASDMRWSPDGTQLAFVAHLPTASQVWVADVKTGEAKAVSDAPVMATLVARPGGGGGDGRDRRRTTAAVDARWVAADRHRPAGSRTGAAGARRAGHAGHPPHARQGNADDDPAVPAAHAERRAAVQVLHDGAARDPVARQGAASDRPADHVSRLLGEPRRQVDPAREHRRTVVVSGGLLRLRPPARSDRSRRQGALRDPQASAAGIELARRRRRTTTRRATSSGVPTARACRSCGARAAALATAGTPTRRARTA